VTGAAGSVGTETLSALTEHDVTALTHRTHDDLESTVVDIQQPKTVEGAFDGHDVVVHLAAASSADGSWDDAVSVNIEGTKHVLEAARKTGVERVVFGSSNHVTHMYNMNDPHDPRETAKNREVVDAETQFRPSSFYGVSKLTGEGLGSLYADRFGLEVVNLRIGHLLEEEELKTLQDGSSGRARQARALWLSPRDYRQAIKQAVTTPLTENPLTVNLVSQNDDRYHSLTHTIRSLGYRPRDNSATIVDE